MKVSGTSGYSHFFEQNDVIWMYTKVIGLVYKWIGAHVGLHSGDQCFFFFFFFFGS